MGILEVLGLKDLAAYEAHKRAQAERAGGLSDMLKRTGRAGEVSTAADPAQRLQEQQAFDDARAARRQDHLSDTYSKIEIGYNQRQMEAGFAGQQKAGNTDAYKLAMEQARAALDSAATRENLRRSLSADGLSKPAGAAADLAVETKLKALIERKAADALGAQYAGTIATKVRQLYQATLGAAPTEDQMDDLMRNRPVEYNGYMQAALADLEDTDQASTGRVGLAHYDSRHTKPTEADMLGRVGSAVSPDLKQKSANSGQYQATVRETRPDGTVTVRQVATPTYAGSAGTASATDMAGITLDSVKNRRREGQTNKVSTVKSAEAGLFLIGDSIAQAWQQASLDPLAQNVGAETYGLAYDFGGYHEPMTYQGGLGDTYSIPSGLQGLGPNSQTAPAATPFSKIKTRLDNIQLERDNPGAKVVMKQDARRGGYDPYTMFSQVAAGTGMQVLQRGPAPNAATPGAVIMAGNKPATQAMDWEAAGKAQAARLKMAAAQAKAAAGAGLTAAQQKLALAETAQTKADAEFATAAKAAPGGADQYGLLANLTEVMEAEAARDLLAELLQEATGLAQTAEARQLPMLGAPPAGPRPLGLPPQDPRVLEVQQQLDANKQRCRDQVAAVQAKAALAAARLTQAAAALQGGIDGLKAAKIPEPAIAELLAKGRGKLAANQEASEAATLVEGAKALLAQAAEDERRAVEDWQTIDAGGFEPFLQATLQQGRAAAKAGLEAEVAKATTPDAKAQALSALLADAKAERKALREQRSQSRHDAMVASGLAEAAAEEEDDKARRRVQEAEAFRQRPGHDPEALQLATEILEAEQEAAAVVRARRDAAAAFEATRRAAIWDQILDDEAQDCRAEAETLRLAAEVGIAKGVGTAKVQAARQGLATALTELQAVLAASAAAGDATRRAQAAETALTRELTSIQAKLDGLRDAQKALGAAAPAVLAEKIAQASALQTKLQPRLADAQTARIAAVAERAKQAPLMDAAREAVDAARAALADASKA